MAASSKAAKKMRSWKNEDSFEESDVVRLFYPEKIKYTKPPSWCRYWKVYVAVFGLYAIFTIGILLGFFLRVDPNVTKKKYCLRSDGFSEEKLQAIHNNVMYSISTEEMSRHARKLKTQASEERFKYVKEMLSQLQLDDVQVTESTFVVTYAGPDSRLDVWSSNGSVNNSVVVSGSSQQRAHNSSKRVNSTGIKAAPFGEYVSPGKSKGPLVYGNQGRALDFLKLKVANVTLPGSVLLLQLATMPVNEQVKLASEAGCVGVILYRCHGNQYQSHQYTAFMYGKDVRLSWNLPVLTVTCEVASQLLANMTALSTIEKHWLSLSGQQHSLFPDGNDTSRLVVSMDVAVLNSTQTAKTVVGVVYGSDNPEVEVIIQASRDQITSPYSDLTNNISSSTGTLLLLELARSIASIRHREQWKPRRTVKFVSCGPGACLDNIGIESRIKENQMFSKQKAVSLINIDAHQIGNDITNSGSDIMKFKSSPGFVDLVKNAADMVPDPNNPEFSLAEIWKEETNMQNLANQSGVEIYKIGKRAIGSPSISLSYLSNVSDNVTRGVNSYKYLQSAGRVLSLVTAMLLDKPLLPFNITHFVQYYNDVIARSVKYVRENLPASLIQSDSKGLLEAVRHNLGKLVKSSNKVAASTEVRDCTRVSELNKIAIQLEAMFSYNNNRFAQSSSYDQTGILLPILDAVETSRITKKLDTVNSALFDVLQSLQQANDMLDALLS